MFSTIIAALAALLLQAAPQEDLRETKAYHGLTLTLAPDGRVTLKLREKDGPSEVVEQTYTAASIEDFKKMYPEIAREYRIDRLRPDEEPRLPGPGALADDFEDWKKRFENLWFWDTDGLDRRFGAWPAPFRSEELTGWIENQRRLFDEFRKMGPPAFGESGPAPRFGADVRPAGAALKAQLGLEGGLVVAEVAARSAAEKAGLQRHDVLLKIGAEPIRDVPAFVMKVRELLPEGFELSILRSGKDMTLRVEPLP